MKERARHARRILRDHRREPGLYTHHRLDFKRGNVEGYTLWVCPRCPKRARTPFEGLLKAAQQASEQLIRNVARTATPWDELKAELELDADQITVDRPVVSGQHRLVPDAEERRAFDPYVGLERLARDFQGET